MKHTAEARRVRLQRADRFYEYSLSKPSAHHFGFQANQSWAGGGTSPSLTNEETVVVHRAQKQHVEEVLPTVYIYSIVIGMLESSTT